MQSDAINFSRLMDMRAESDLRLVDFAPRTMLRVPSHQVDRSRFPVIDFHNHLDDFEPDAVLRIMDDCNVEAVLNITTAPGSDGLAVLKRFHNAASDRFYTCMWMDWRDIAVPGFWVRTVQRLEQFVQAGGVGLKLWKDLGLSVRDSSGGLLRIDDERLAPLFDKAAELGVFVMFHTADPEAFFQPVDRYNERFEELVAHPDWSFCGSALTQQQVLAQRNRVFQRHPKTQFLCAHMAEQSENLASLAALLDDHPNVSVDLSARVNELGRQPFTARRFLIKYAGRILFGTDLPVDQSVYRSSFRFLETEDEYFEYPSHASRQGRWMAYGLGLPDSALRKVYRENARRLLRQSKRQRSGKSPQGARD
jgi:hypothetical protein